MYEYFRQAVACILGKAPKKKKKNTIDLSALRDAATSDYDVAHVWHRVHTRFNIEKQPYIFGARNEKFRFRVIRRAKWKKYVYEVFRIKSFI